MSAPDSAAVNVPAAIAPKVKAEAASNPTQISPLTTFEYLLRYPKGRLLGSASYPGKTNSEAMAGAELLLGGESLPLSGFAEITVPSEQALELAKADAYQSWSNWLTMQLNSTIEPAERLESLLPKSGLSSLFSLLSLYSFLILSSWSNLSRLSRLSSLSSLLDLFSFQPAANEVVVKLKNFRKAFYFDLAKMQTRVQPPASQYSELISALKKLSTTLAEFESKLSTFQAASDNAFGDTEGRRVTPRYIFGPYRIKHTMNETQDVFTATLNGLQSLIASIKLVAALEEAYLPGTRGLQQAAKSSKQNVAPFEASQNPRQIQSESTHSVKRRPRAKLSESIRYELKQIRLSTIDRRYNPFRGSNESSFVRHKYFHDQWLSGTCEWFISSNEFWDKWLFGGPKGPKIFNCWGPSGVGKSIITARVIDTLEYMDYVCAHYYLGEGHVQSAKGLALSLISQLSNLADVYPSSRSTGITPDPPEEQQGGVENPNASSGFDQTAGTASLVPERTDIAAVPRRTGSGFPSSSLSSRPETVKDTASEDVPKGKEAVCPYPTEPHSETDSERHKPVDSPAELPRIRDSLDTLLDILRDVCVCIQSPVFFILDAWDEANMENIDDFISIVDALNPSNCKVFITSRKPLSRIRYKSIQLEVGHPRNFDDVRKYVENILDTAVDNIRDGNSLSESQTRSELQDLSEAIADQSRGVFSFAHMYATNIDMGSGGQEKVPTVEINTRLGLQFGLMPKVIRRMREKTNPLEPREILSQVLHSLKVTRPGDLLQSLILIWLSVAPSLAPLSIPDLEMSLPSISNRFSLPDIQIEDISRAFRQLSGLITIDPGNNLVRLSSDAMKEEVESIWIKSWVQSVPELKPENVKRHIAFCCIEYYKQATIDKPDLRTETGVKHLLQTPFLAHAVTAWNIYYRNSTEAPEASRETTATDAEGTSIDDDKGVFSQTPLVKPDHRRIIDLITELISQRDSLSLLILVPIYLSREPTIASLTWKELQSWVSSMSTLHMVSRLGLVSLVYGELDLSLSEVNGVDENGRTPLHESVQAAYDDDVRWLLKTHASLLVRDNLSKTAMDYAVDGGREDIFLPLFEKFCEKLSHHLRIDNAMIRKMAEHYAKYVKADSETSVPILDLALVHAIRERKYTVALTLLQAGANPNCQDEKGTPALHHAIQLVNSPSSFPTRDIAYSIIALLFEYGADPSIKSADEKGEPGLHVAARARNFDLLRMLVNCGADPSAPDARGQTLLFAIVAVDETDEAEIEYILRWLLMRGVDAEQPNCDGRRVLHLAAERGLTRVIVLLVQRFGLSCAPLDDQGKKPLDYARDAGHEEAADLLQWLTGRDDRIKTGAK